MMKNCKSIEIYVENEKNHRCRRNAKSFGILRKFRDKKRILAIFHWITITVCCCLPKSIAFNIQVQIPTIIWNWMVSVLQRCFSPARTLAVMSDSMPHKTTNIISLMDLILINFSVAKHIMGDILCQINDWIWSAVHCNDLCRSISANDDADKQFMELNKSTSARNWKMPLCFRLKWY